MTPGVCAVALALAPPPGWVPDHALAAPTLGSSPPMTVEVWQVWRPPGPDAASSALVGACFAGEAAHWTDEAEPLAFDAVTQMAGATALRIAGVGGLAPAGPVARQGDARSRPLAGDGDGEGRLTAESFLGFARCDGEPHGPPTHLVGCFALCVDSDARCAAQARAARLSGPLRAAPPPSLTVRSLLALVHHPRATAAGMAALACLGGLTAVATRKRPRRRAR